MITRLRILAAIAFGLTVLVACGTPTPPTVQQELTVLLAGTGDGSVTSTPAGIDTAGGVFDAEFAEGTEVTLTADAAAGSSFAGWSGACTADPCVVTMDAAKSATATFTLDVVSVPETLEVAVVTGGIAEGNVTSDPAGIDTLGGVDTFEFDTGTTVTLTANATVGGFAGWTGGDCDGVKTLTCEVTMTVGEAPVTANFNDVSTLDLAINGDFNDAEEFVTASSSDPTAFQAGYTYPLSSDLELVTDPDHALQVVGLRFTGATIPEGARIATATLGFTAFSNPSTGTLGQATVTIAAQLATSTTEFVDDPINQPGTFGISSRAETTAAVDWVLDEQWTALTVYESANAASVVQEVVAQPDWGIGDGTLVFLLTGAGDEYRRAYSYDRAADLAAPERAPTLFIEYVEMPVVVVL